MPTERVSNWRQALEALDLDLLKTIIDMVMEFERMTGRPMTALELRAALTGDLGLGIGGS